MEKPQKLRLFWLAFGLSWVLVGVYFMLHSLTDSFGIILAGIVISVFGLTYYPSSEGTQKDLRIRFKQYCNNYKTTNGKLVLAGLGLVLSAVVTLALAFYFMSLQEAHPFSADYSGVWGPLIAATVLLLIPGCVLIAVFGLLMRIELYKRQKEKVGD
jgi:hypothetical protein